MAVTTQFYSIPTIDVPASVLFDAYYARPDIAQQQVNAGAKKPDGTYIINPTTGQINNPNDIPALMRWWWQQDAAGNDKPSLYGNSFAVWAHQVLGMNVTLPTTTSGGSGGGSTSGGGVNIVVGGSDGSAGDGTNEGITSDKFVWFGVALLAAFWLTGFRRDEQLKYLPSPLYQGVRYQNPRKKGRFHRRDWFSWIKR